MLSPKYLGRTNWIVVWSFTCPGRGSGNSGRQVSRYQRITVVWHAGRKVHHTTELTWEVYWGRGGEGCRDQPLELGADGQRERERGGPSFYKEV